MPAMIVLIPRQDNGGFPHILEALRVLPTARRLGCDRVRIETADGARVSEWSVDQLAQHSRTIGLNQTPNERRLTFDADLESRRALVPGFSPLIPGALTPKGDS